MTRTRYNNFAVTSLGRCGTKFLRNVLNTSDSFHVNHEMPGDAQLFDRREEHLCQVNARFNDMRNQTDYGEVNSYLRFIIEELEVDCKLIIIRHPLDILNSALKRRPNSMHRETLVPLVRHINTALIHFAYLIEKKNFPLARFERMTGHPNYINGIARNQLGIDDLNTDLIDFTKKVDASPVDNPNDIKFFKPEHWEIVSVMDWFINTYYGGGDPECLKS